MGSSPLEWSRGAIHSSVVSSSLLTMAAVGALGEWPRERSSPVTWSSCSAVTGAGLGTSDTKCCERKQHSFSWALLKVSLAFINASSGKAPCCVSHTCSLSTTSLVSKASKRWCPGGSATTIMPSFFSPLTTCSHNFSFGKGPLLVSSQYSFSMKVQAFNCVVPLRSLSSIVI